MLGLLVAAQAAVATPPAAASSCSLLRAAADTGRAGLVVQFGDESVREFCVSFAREGLSGLDLLLRSGLEVVYEDHGAAGVTVCRVGDTGSDFPREPCFARCGNVASGCVFWGYYRLDRESGAWRFSELGAAATVVRDGDVEGWRWGEHSAGGGNPPAPTTLEAVCARAVAQPRAEPAGRAPGRGAPPAWTLAAFGVLVVGLGALAVRRARAARRPPP